MSRGQNAEVTIRKLAWQSWVYRIEQCRNLPSEVHYLQLHVVIAER
jgi:hypothetical protein